MEGKQRNFPIYNRTSLTIPESRVAFFLQIGVPKLAMGFPHFRVF